MGEKTPRSGEAEAIVQVANGAAGVTVLMEQYPVALQEFSDCRGLLLEFRQLRGPVHMPLGMHHRQNQTHV